MDRRSFLSTVGATMIGAAAGVPLVSCKGGGEMEAARRLELGGELPDPCMVRSGDSYYLLGTRSRDSDTRRYNMFRSDDLTSWEDLGCVLEWPVYEGSREANYWAPEICERDGKWYMYYTSDSFGINERRYVRVGVADRVEGPYSTDSGPATVGPSIDGHPCWLAGDDGWLFYTGNEGNEHVGQLLMERLVSPAGLDGRPRRVFPDQDVPWEEGAFVVGHDGMFYLFSSMGNWRDGTYHVLCAEAERVSGPWRRLMEGEEKYRVLETVEGQFGPGHNSVFVGPDGRQWICYHAWDRDRTGRYPWVAPILWQAGRPVVMQK